MANVFSVNVYQLNQGSPIPLNQVTAIGLPVSGVLAFDISGSPQRSLSTGVNVYSMAQVAATGNKYYCRETFAQLLVLIG